MARRRRQTGDGATPAPEPLQEPQIPPDESLPTEALQEPQAEPLQEPQAEAPPEPDAPRSADAPAEPSVTVYLVRHTTEYPTYRRAGLVLRREPVSEALTAEQVAILEADPWVRIEPAPDGAPEP